MAKTESQMLREWARILEVDPMSHMGDIGRTSPHRGDPVMSPDLGGGVGPGGAGRSAGKAFAGKAKAAPTRIEPKLEPGSKPKIQIKPGETPAQAVQRAKKDLELKSEPAATRPAPDSRGRVEPSLKPLEPMTAGTRAKGPPVSKSLGQSLKDMPHKKKAAAALGLGALWMMNRDGEEKPQTTTTVEPADDWGKAGSTAPDYETEKSEPSGQVGGAGTEVPQGKRSNSVSVPTYPSPSSKPATEPSPAAGPSTTPGPSSTGSSKKGGAVDDEYDYATRMTTVRESNYTIFTRHPVTGETYQLTVTAPIMESTSDLSNSYNCGVVRQQGPNAWSCHVWSATPISKLIKGQ